MKLACDLIACALLSLLAAWLLWWAGASAAPVPAPRAAPAPARPPLPGEYRMLWGGTEYRAVFWLGGDYVSFRPESAPWRGRWEVKGDTLTIRERVSDAGDYSETTFELKPGKWESAAAFSLKLTRLP